jgi:hypothetical protein
MSSRFSPEFCVIVPKSKNNVYLSMSPHEETSPTQRASPPLEPEIRQINAAGRPQHRNPGHQPTSSNASSSSTCSSNSNTDESSDSYLDSLEEGRTPLLGEFSLCSTTELCYLYVLICF